ncbi:MULTISPECIES: methyl-accepting chemotaxis protein [unclassified Lysinibacillus]|uniref:methyl-accepting chemotaxis protein n=1 Tax=unclassified Lysinibacillus TaxID=2636778 RepID=UPI00131EF611|nr:MULTISPECIES: HAMP domain-containing methyl-accepting chemotaxis protein [unclassified Lysinibacillus]
MSIRNKLLTGFAISIFVTVLACITIFIQLKNIESQYSDTLNTGLPQTYSTAELSRLSMAQATLVQNYIMGKDTKQAIQTRRDEVNGLISELDQSLNNDNETAQALITSIKEKAEVMHQSFDEALSLKDKKGLATAADYYINTAGMNVITFMDDATLLSSEISETFVKAQNDADAKMNRAFIITIIAIIIAIAAGVITALFITKRIAKPMHKLEQHVQEITNGNLAIEPLTIHSKDEIGNLSLAMNEMKDTLTKLLYNLSDNAGHLSSTSEELMASAEEVNAAASIMLDGAKAGAQSASNMSTSAMESSTAMDETATAVQKIAQSTQDLHSFASQTEDMAKSGSQNIHTASDQMSSIYQSTKLTTELIQKLSQQSKEIETITQVITGISDQTNLLALNAAIEAARAGEHGKGFAVVADEVRKLAEESNRSAGKIGTLTNEIQQDTKNVEQAIEVSLNNVEQGVGIIELAGQTFDQIVGAIEDMKEQIEDVSAVTEQISATAEEVAASVSEIARSSEMTRLSAEQSFDSSEQQMSSLQEISAVANDLSGRAQELQQVVSNYRL